MNQPMPFALLSTESTFHLIEVEFYTLSHCRIQHTSILHDCERVIDNIKMTASNHGIGCKIKTEYLNTV